MQPNSELAHGRFVGPAKLIELAEALGADLSPAARMRPAEFLGTLERWGQLVPVQRYSEPLPIRVRRHAEDHPRDVDPDLPQEGDTPRVLALIELQRRLERWGRHGTEVGRLHPYDDPPDDAREFFIDPATSPAASDVYAPVRVGRLPDGGPLMDDRHRVAIYRRWQALHLYELAIGELHVLHRPGDGDVLKHTLARREHSGKVPETLAWSHIPDVLGFAEHRKALEAANWFEAYAQRALNLAEGRDEPDGLSVVEGSAYEALLLEERAIADEALARHGASEENLQRMIRWAARQAVRHGRRGRPRVEQAYKAVVVGAFRLLELRGRTFDEIADQVGGGDLRRLFPDWLADQRERAFHTLSRRIVPEVVAALGGLLRAPTEGDAAAFLAWLEAGGLIQVFWHFDALQALHGRSDSLALAALGREVIGMSAALEHIANELGAKGNGLHQKFKSLFGGTVAALMDQHAVKVGQGLTEAEFRAGLGSLRSVLWQPGDAAVCRCLLEAVLVRNQAQHRALAFMGRYELVDIFITLLRAVFLTWFAVQRP